MHLTPPDNLILSGKHFLNFECIDKNQFHRFQNCYVRFLKFLQKVYHLHFHNNTKPLEARTKPT